MKEIVADYETEQLRFLDSAVTKTRQLLESITDDQSWQHRSLIQNLNDLEAWRNDLRSQGLTISRVELFAPSATQKILEHRLGPYAKMAPIPARPKHKPLPSKGTGGQVGIMGNSDPLDSWVPTDGYSSVDADQDSRYTYQYFGWALVSPDPDYYLRYFRDGGNHTFEQETHYDGWDESENCWNPLPGGGGYWGPCPQVYANDIWQGAWNSNLPQAYYDTTFSNNPNEPNLVIGTADATQLHPLHSGS